VTADPRVARLRSLDTEATPGPWRPVRGGYTLGSDAVANIAHAAEQNVALIAAMRNAWPAVVTLLEHTLDVGCSYTTLARDAMAVLDTLDPP
jgi:hypothetical protein